MTGLWFLGYLGYVLITPAKFDIQLFLIPLIICAVIETIEYYISKGR